MKKGFTLIELLAVILILGIIALIAIPTVNNILKEARRGAFNSTLTNLEKAVEEKCTTEQIKNIEITTNYTITDGVISPSLDIKGDLPDGTITVNTNCEVAFELSNNNFTGNKDFVGDIVITDGSSIEQKYKEEILNGADPVYSSNLIPVIIEDDGTVKKANVKEKWYSYAEKWWANAVILTDTGKVENDGTILEDSIESYFVWVPRFKYKLFNVESYESAINQQLPSELTPKTIEVIFENKNTEISNGDEVDEYLSHPAFRDFDINGFWVGKFESSGSINDVKIKPNQESIKNIDVKTMFESSYNYNRNNDSHMMKNTEWGAVAYLSLSKYGINKRININNNTNDITGYSAVVALDDVNYNGENGTDSSVTQPYNTVIGYKASSTGNITGIYDMSGGTYEYVAAYVDGYGAVESGFTSDPATIYGSKYFNIYPSGGYISNYNHRILGDATGEIGPFYYYNYVYKSSWYGEGAFFIYDGSPWFHRGGVVGNGNLAGQLQFNYSNGEVWDCFTFRVVLTK